MRQVRARETASGRSASPSPRAKTKSRTPQPRSGSRSAKSRDSEDRSLLERLRGSFPARRPMLTLTLALVVIGALTGLVAGGHVSRLFDSMGAGVEDRFAGAGFAVKGITIAGNEHTTKDEAIAALGVKEGGSIFAASPSQTRKRLMRLPWVSDAEVRRQLPDTVFIRLIEKRPFALWRNGAEIAVIERSGGVITAAQPESFAKLPMLAGAGAPKAAAAVIDALRTHKAISARIQSAERVGERRWDLILAGGVTVKLPEEGWQAQLDELERLIVEQGILERDIEIIDLRYPDNYVFRLHNGDSRPMPRERRA